jgi:hypothetical protein
VLQVQYPISATPHNTAREPRGPWALPGELTVRLTVGGKRYTQPLTVKMDPRIKTSPAAIAAEHAMAVALFDAMVADSAIAAQGRVLHDSLATLRERVATSGDQRGAARIAAVADSLSALLGQSPGGGRRGRGPASSTVTVASVSGQLLPLMQLLEDADAEPTTQAVAAVRRVQRDQAAIVARWNALEARAASLGPVSQATRRPF